MMFKKVVFLLLLPITVIGYGQSSLQKTINQLVNDKELKHASISIAVMELSSGKMIAGYEGDRSLSPASILKLLTTATTLGILGGDYQFKTELSYSGYIGKAGTLYGDLFITGYGDPTLGSGRLEGAADLPVLMNHFVDAVVKKGIKKIKGSIVGDGSYFDTAANALGWQWIDLGNYYAAGVWGLNINENLYHLTFAQTPKVGQTPRIIGISPEVRDLSFINELTSGASGSGDNAYIYGAPYTYNRFVRGTIPKGFNTFTIKGSLPDAPLFAAQLLTEYLENEGVALDRGGVSDLTYRGILSAGSTRSVLLTHHSPRLRDIVKVTNHKSINLYCEAMLKTIGVEGGKRGSLKSGVSRIKSYWEERGLNFSGIKITDGSGLSQTNMISAEFMVRLLRKISLNKTIYKDFYSSLSIAGKTGYVKSILKNTQAQGNLRAKTGTMEGVRSFAGYATMANGKKVSFCIIVNNFEGSGRNIRQKCAKVMQSICE